MEERLAAAAAAGGWGTAVRIAGVPAGRMENSNDEPRKTKRFTNCPMRVILQVRPEAALLNDVQEGLGTDTSNRLAPERVHLLCPDGRYRASNGECISCPPRKVAQAAVSECNACPVGQEPNSDQSKCVDCAAGQYQDEVGSDVCEACAPGQYQDSMGQDACFTCSVGNFADKPGSTSCDECPRGQFASEAGLSFCKACAAGQYQDEDGQTECAMCAAGQYQDEVGSDACEVCGVGRYQDEEGQTECAMCAAGQYTSSTGLPSCVYCPAGTFSKKLGASSADDCVPSPPVPEVNTFVHRLGSAAGSFRANGEPWLLDVSSAMSMNASMEHGAHLARLNDFLLAAWGMRWEDGHAVSVNASLAHGHRAVGVVCAIEWRPGEAAGLVEANFSDVVMNYTMGNRSSFVASPIMNQTDVILCGSLGPNAVYLPNDESAADLGCDGCSIRVDHPGVLHVSVAVVLLKLDDDGRIIRDDRRFQGNPISPDRIVTMDARVVETIPTTEVWEVEAESVDGAPLSLDSLLLTEYQYALMVRLVLGAAKLHGYQYPPDVHRDPQEPIQLQCSYPPETVLFEGAVSHESVHPDPKWLSWSRMGVNVSVGLTHTSAMLRTNVSEVHQLVPRTVLQNMMCRPRNAPSGLGQWGVSLRIPIVPTLRAAWSDIAVSVPSSAGDGPSHWSSSWLWDDASRGRVTLAPLDGLRGNWSLLSDWSASSHPSTLALRQSPGVESDGSAGGGLPKAIRFAPQVFPNQTVALVCFALDGESAGGYRSLPCFGPGTTVRLSAAHAEMEAFHHDWSALSFRVPSYEAVCGHQPGSSRRDCGNPTLVVKNPLLWKYHVAEGGQIEMEPLAVASSTTISSYSDDDCLRRAHDAAVDHLDAGGSWSILLGGCSQFRHTAPRPPIILRTGGRVENGNATSPRRLVSPRPPSGVEMPSFAPPSRALSTQSASRAQEHAMNTVFQSSTSVDWDSAIHLADWCPGFDPPSSSCMDLSSGARCAFGEGAYCQPCPRGAVCPGGFRAWPLRGFWTHSASSAEVHRCPPPANERCLGWNRTAQASTCGEGYGPDTPSCEGCAPGFYPGDSGCLACPEGDRSGLAVRPLLYLVAGVLCIVFFYDCVGADGRTEAGGNSGARRLPCDEVPRLGDSHVADTGASWSICSTWSTGTPGPSGLWFTGVYI